VPKPEGSPRDGRSACAQPIAPHGFTVYTEQEQVAFLRRAGFSDVPSRRRKGPFVSVFALAAKARPSAASPWKWGVSSTALLTVAPDDQQERSQDRFFSTKKALGRLAPRGAGWHASRKTAAAPTTS